MTLWDISPPSTKRAGGWGLWAGGWGPFYPLIMLTGTDAYPHISYIFHECVKLQGFIKLNKLWVFLKKYIWQKCGLTACEYSIYSRLAGPCHTPKELSRLSLPRRALLVSSGCQWDRKSHKKCLIHRSQFQDWSAVKLRVSAVYYQNYSIDMPIPALQLHTNCFHRGDYGAHDCNKLYNQPCRQIKQENKLMIMSQ